MGLIVFCSTSVFVAQIASKGKLTSWGAKVGRQLFGAFLLLVIDTEKRGTRFENQLHLFIKEYQIFLLLGFISSNFVIQINSLIDRGEIWRLGTSSLLHANIGHLMVCFV